MATPDEAAIRTYLDYQRFPDRRVTEEMIHDLEERALAEEDTVEAARLLTEAERLTVLDPDRIERDFIRNVKAWTKQTGVSASALARLGVSAEVLGAAGLTSGTDSAPTARRRGAAAPKKQTRAKRGGRRRVSAKAGTNPPDAGTDDATTDDVTTDDVTTDDAASSTAVRSVSLTAAQQQAYEQMTLTPFTINGVADASGVHQMAVRRLVAQLVEGGQVEELGRQEGAGNAQWYKLADRANSDTAAV